MLNSKLLKARMVLLDVSPQALAESMGWSKSTLYRKLNGDRPFTVEEIDVCVDKLELNNDMLLAIFFNG